MQMQKVTEFLNAVGKCLCGAAQLFSEYNNYQEAKKKEVEKSSIKKGKEKA